MGIDPQQLLRTLGSGVRPTGAEGGAPGRGSIAGGGSFADMLREASSGSAGRAPVSVAKNAGVDLSPGQLERLAQAADRAQAEGADRALVLIDGMTLKLDVATRTITGRVTADGSVKGPRVHTGVDAVVTVPAADEVAIPGVVPPPGGVSNPSLARLLHDRDDRAA